MQRMLFIFNRHAGKDRNWMVLADIVNTMTAQGYLVTTYPTQAPGDAGEAITRWGSSYDRIVVAGGDGTLNEAVAGLIRLPDKPPLGYIPIGSTNDFSKNLSLPSLPADAALAATEGVPRLCDAAKFNGRPFIYVAAFGAFADVSFNTPQSSKNLLGYAAYLLESVKRLPSIKPYQITAECDGRQISGAFLYGMVSNTASVAGIQHFPLGDPKLDDGLLEVTLISPPKDIVELERLGRLLLLGDPLEKTSPLVQTFSTAKISIHAQEELLWTLDGENGGAHRTAEIEVIPQAFTIVHGA
jgi:YegS/Rv2252/BmrU family lipid kinase